MSNEKKISIEKVISDIKESNGNGKRKGCHGLHQCLSDDGYIRQIVCWTRITSPDRIDALVEHADKQNAEITALRTALTALTALTSQLESVVAENAARKSEVPLGAIENGRAFADRLEAYSFECQGGNLSMCSDWQELIRCFEHLAEWAMHGQDETPVTAAFLAEVRASGADECVRQLVISDDDDFSDAPNVCAMVAHQLRQGGAV